MNPSVTRGRALGRLARALFFPEFESYDYEKLVGLVAHLLVRVVR